MTDKVVKLSRRTADPVPQDVVKPETVAQHFIEQTARLMLSRVEDTINSLETLLTSIRMCLKSLPDGEISERLTSDHVILTAALDLARNKAAALMREIDMASGGVSAEPNGAF